MTMTDDDIDTVILVAQVIFDKNSSGTFCGCLEGDLDNEYPRGVEHFLKALRGTLEEIADNQQEEGQ